MAEDITKITLEELQANGGIAITKKYLLINSSMYTDEAYEYILSLVDEVGAIAFISDQRKIYAQGEYFGGDLWAESLYYFSEYDLINEEDELVNRIVATEPQQILRYKGEEGITLKSTTDGIAKTTTMHIGFDIDSKVNKEKFTIDSKSVYNLAVEDGQIKMRKYTPASLYVSPFTPLEFDSGDQMLTFNITVSGTDPLTSFTLTTVPEVMTQQVEDSNSVIAQIPNNTDVKFIMDFSDGTTTDTYSITQKWGFACAYSESEEITFDNFKDMNHYLTTSSINKTLTIEQNGDVYGWYACPSSYKVKFTDSSTNLQGGWSKYSTFTYYSNGIEYTVYRTDNSGLGKVKWIIESE